MEKWQRSIIVKNKATLINLITPNQELLSVLEANEILSTIELENLDCVGTQRSRTDQATKLLDILVKRDKGSDGQYVFDVLIHALKESKQGKPAGILEQGKQDYLSSNGQLPKQLEKQQEGCFPSKVKLSEPPIATSSEPPRPSQSTSLPPPQQQIAKTSSSLKDEYLQIMTTKLNVKIEKPSSWSPSLPDGAYNINPDKPGAVLIINIREFPPYQLKMNDGKVKNCNMTRIGAELDAKYMRDLWRGLGYTIFREEEINWEEGKWTKEDILDMIKDFRKFCNQKKPDSIVLFISSHGEDDAILTSDPPEIELDDFGNEKAIHQKVKIKKEILTQFYDAACPGLKNKPKVFLINGCQVFPSEHTDKIRDLGSPASDLIVVFSQVPGHVSLRNEKFGSWFVHCLTFVMMKSVKERDFDDVVNEVARILQEKPYVGEDEYGNKFKHGQAPTKLTLGSTKKLYFPLKP